MNFTQIHKNDLRAGDKVLVQTREGFAVLTVALLTSGRVYVESVDAPVDVHYGDFDDVYVMSPTTRSVSIDTHTVDGYNKIKTIKAIRSATGLGLKDAKDASEGVIFDVPIDKLEKLRYDLSLCGTYLI